MCHVHTYTLYVYRYIDIYAYICIYIYIYIYVLSPEGLLVQSSLAMPPAVFIVVCEAFGHTSVLGFLSLQIKIRFTRISVQFHKSFSSVSVQFSSVRFTSVQLQFRSVQAIWVHTIWQELAGPDLSDDSKHGSNTVPEPVPISRFRIQKTESKHISLHNSSSWVLGTVCQVVAMAAVCSDLDVRWQLRSVASTTLNNAMR